MNEMVIQASFVGDKYLNRNEEKIIWKKKNGRKLQ